MKAGSGVPAFFIVLLQYNSNHTPSGYAFGISLEY